MCSISGIINYESKSFEEKSIDFKQILNHRGPDHQVNDEDTNYFISMNRLKIIDLSNEANQPFKSKDKNITIIYNGEIYNYDELKNKYFSNYKFNSNVDGEILIPLYEKYGMDLTSKIRGMYSIFIYDKKKIQVS